MLKGCRFSDVPRDVDGDSDKDYCLNGYWWDCNSDSNCAAREWCDFGAKDCKADFRPACYACSRDAQCWGDSCINGHCTSYTTEAGLCSDGKDNDCDGLIDFPNDPGCCTSSESGLCYNDDDDDCDGPIDFEDSDCCGNFGAGCSSDSQCCNGVPCNPVENGKKCGCPTDYSWDNDIGDCVYLPETCEEGAPATIECDVPSWQNGFCLFPLTPIYSQSCCYASSYGGIDYYELEAVVVKTV